MDMKIQPRTALFSSLNLSPDSPCLFSTTPVTVSISVLRHRTFSRQFSTTNQQIPNNVSSNPQPGKNLHKDKRKPKVYSSLAPILSPDNQPTLSDSQTIGIVTAAQANYMRVVVKSDPEAPRSFLDGPEVYRNGIELLCGVRGLLKKVKRRVMVGDKVLVGSVDWVVRRGVIENVFQRSSEILDPPVANVDHLLVLFSLDQPKPEAYTLTRFLIEAESTQIPLTLAMNKLELVDKETLNGWRDRLLGWGYDPVFCSVETKDGLDHLASTLKDKSSVIVGPSGVGKSSLINALRKNHQAKGAVEEENGVEPIKDGKWFEEQRVGEVSTRSGRGKHTTRHVSLLPLSSGGFVADTPGFNEPSLTKVTKHSLALTFPEIRNKISNPFQFEKCAFSNCLHIGEPGCIVKADWERYPFYFELIDVIGAREKSQLRTFGTKKESEVRYKDGAMGVKQGEAKLNLKKHRRVSRKTIKQSLLDDFDEEDLDYVK